MTDYTKQFAEMAEQMQKMAEQFKPQLPEVKFNKNGYEIRTQVLDMAKSFTEFEFSQKWMGFENSTKRDPQTGQIISKVDMPEIPGVDKVLDTAEKFYDFINKR
mgnify:FL=1|jgi:hypothetical protein